MVACLYVTWFCLFLSRAVSYNLGSGVATIMVNGSFSDGRWHRVKAVRWVPTTGWDRTGAQQEVDVLSTSLWPQCPAPQPAWHPTASDPGRSGRFVTNFPLAFPEHRQAREPDLPSLCSTEIFQRQNFLMAKLEESLAVLWDLDLPSGIRFQGRWTLRKASNLTV